MRKGCGQSWALNDEPLICGEHIEDVGLCRICESKYNERERVMKIAKRFLLTGVYKKFAYAVTDEEERKA